MSLEHRSAWSRRQLRAAEGSLQAVSSRRKASAEAKEAISRKGRLELSWVTPSSVPGKVRHLSESPYTKHRDLTTFGAGDNYKKNHGASLE